MSRPRRAVIAAARRTPVCPRGGALSAFQADELAASVLTQLIRDTEIQPECLDHVFLGNALYGGGNPARMAALRAGLPQTVPALTVDTQCCSGLDAILLGARLIESGAARCVLAGGMESFSRAPIRMHRPADKNEAPLAYDRPPFAPRPFDDPDLTQAAAQLAASKNLTRTLQAKFAVRSHKKAQAAPQTVSAELVAPADVTLKDSFTRALSISAALRAPVLAGDEAHGLSAATIACEADAAAAVFLMAEDLWLQSDLPGLVIADGLSVAGDPGNSASAPDAAGRHLLKTQMLQTADIDAVELMEAYASQAMATVSALGIKENSLNQLGGALARGHPIGASGAILAVNLFALLAARNRPAHGAKKTGMALIAAAGGLGAGLLVQTPGFTKP